MANLVTCLICSDERKASVVCEGCRCSICDLCAVQYIRSALGNARAEVGAEGVKCPNHHSGCAYKISADTMRKARGRKRRHTRALADDELNRFEEFAILATIPDCEKVFCPNPNCGLVSIAPDAGQLVQCPHCRHRWKKGEEDKERDDAKGEEDKERDDATSRMIEHTSKPCPSCGVRVSHYHGHGCHHISPEGGCPGCHQHFCYVCLRKHGTPGQKTWNSGCTHKSSFCKDVDILTYLKRDPYPHDTRCGCPLCPDCKPGRPCSQCGKEGCVVCRGEVTL